MKSYKEMSYSELIAEHNRVSELLRINKKPFTQKQNRKYLAKIEKEIDEYELSRQTSRNGL